MAWILGLLGCGDARSPRERPSASAAAPTPTVTTTPPRPAGANEPANILELDCGPEVEGIEPLLARPQLVLLGEDHGTTEIPALMGRLACHASAHGLEVGVGFEAYGDQGDAFARYVASAGSADAQAALLEAPHWAPDPDVADGRSSVAMLALFEELRRLHAQGRPVFVFPAGPRNPEERALPRDHWMAQRVADAHAAHPDALIFVIAGAGHAAIRTAEQQPGIGTSMAWYLVHDHALPVISLSWRRGGGERWDPAAAGYRSAMPGEDLGRADFIEHRNERSDVDGDFYVGPTTASPPARAPEILSPTAD